MLKQTGEKPDLKLSACVWRGPYASCAVKEEDKTTEIFELTEDGSSCCRGMDKAAVRIQT